MNDEKKPPAKKAAAKKVVVEPCKFCAAPDGKSHTRHCPSYIRPVRKV
jgi:hypothetical protein